MLEYHLLRDYTNAHIVHAYHDTINEELEHPHPSTIILQIEEAPKHMPDDDKINNILENDINPIFYIPWM